MAMAVMFSGVRLQEAPVSVEAAHVTASFLPAAGVGLVLEDGVSVSQIRDDVKKRKAEKEGAVSANSSGETQTTETAEAASSQETQSEEESETEIVMAVEPVLKEPETKISEEEEREQEEKDVLIIAQVNDYVNIRSTPGTDGEIVGKLYNNSVGTLIATEGDWYQMKSGSVEGYVKAEYFKTGDEAKRIADEVGNKVATVNTETLKVRSDASLEASVLGLVPGGEELTVMDENNGFVKVSIEEGDGWVSEDYVIVATEYVTAESIEEERARLAEQEKAKEDARRAAQAAEERMQAKQQAKDQKSKESAAEGSGESSGKSYAPANTSGSGLGQSVADFAVQFVGNPYVYGGTSLTNGADCSGFVMKVYENFGVSLPHSSSADRRVGYSVGSLSEAKAGDLICYSGHVAIYIGGGQIVHASTAATGIKISNADYRTPVAIRRIF
ncbi:MAG: NlpC/P60 family protein [Eubacteriales bacterium]|nr:NlpC/P60 family protein [Eubacteriales bacterium]